MVRLSTCKGCEKQITKEEKYTHSGKSYCKECYEKIQLEKEDYKNLLNTICGYFNIDCCTGLILKQIKDYKEQFNYSYAGIGYTLWYTKEIERKTFEQKYGIALVKYYYEKAKEYFEQQNKISKSITIEQPIDNTKIVKVKNMQNNKNKFLINIDSFFEGGEN